MYTLQDQNRGRELIRTMNKYEKPKKKRKKSKRQKLMDSEVTGQKKNSNG